nr:hypothetical protein [Candidatus Sigynarchaeota archaeon]
MANFSRVGCEFDVTMLQAALAVLEFPDLLWFSTAYLTSGFLVALNKTRCAVAEKTCAGTGMKFHVIGHVVPGSQISLVQGDAKHVLFDWQKNPVFPEP